MELGHVEAAIERHDAIKKAAVTVNPSGQLVAFVIAQDGLAPLADVQLQAHVADLIPEYMVPKNWSAPMPRRDQPHDTESPTPSYGQPIPMIRSAQPHVTESQSPCSRQPHPLA